MSEATALAVLERAPEGETPSALMRRATDVAGVCREIVMRTAMDLQGKKYVKVEGWMSIAAAYGCVPSIREVVEEPQGIRAVAELRRHDGAVLATAEGFVGLDEPRWASQALYARRGMAQTRAISRVCRSVFAFCVVLIDENLQTTPAEEIPHGAGVADVVDVVARPAAPKASGAPVVRDASTKIPYGKSKGKHLCDATDEDISWLLGAAKKSVDANDPKWHAKNVKWLEAVQAEAARRVGGMPETGKVSAPSTTSPRQAELPVDGEEEIVTPAQRFFQLARESGLGAAALTSRAKGVLNKAAGWTHADIDTLEVSIRAVPVR
jgi:hypothetical protein